MPTDLWRRAASPPPSGGGRRAGRDTGARFGPPTRLAAGPAVSGPVRHQGRPPKFGPPRGGCRGDGGGEGRAQRGSARGDG